MPTIFTHTFDTPLYKGTVNLNTGLYIDGQFVDSVKGETYDVINPTTGKKTTTITVGAKEDVDIAVKVARKAFDTVWGLNSAGYERGVLLENLARLMEQYADELSALEAFDNGKTFNWARAVDIPASTKTIRYYAGWADKNHGKVIDVSGKLAYTSHEPIGVVGQIIPWNFPLMMMAWKIGPALATGNTIVLKPSEYTPLTALRMAELISQAGFPAGVVNIINGLGSTVGEAISGHMDIEKVAFTGSTLTGRKIMEAAARSNLKKVTLELGGKSPNIVFDDCDLDEAVNWATHGLFWNHGQCCCAGTRIFVHEKIYDDFVARFTAKTESLKVGDPFDDETFQGPLVSDIQFERVMNYIRSGVEDGAKLVTGGQRHGTSGFFVQPTLFTHVPPSAKIMREEIFGPVGVITKFSSEEEVIAQANDTQYGLAAAVFTKDVKRALRVVKQLKAGTCWVNCANTLDASVPFGGYKMSGIGRELGEYALANYTAVKAVHVNMDLKI